MSALKIVTFIFSPSLRDLKVTFLVNCSFQPSPPPDTTCIARVLAVSEGCVSNTSNTSVFTRAQAGDSSIRNWGRSQKWQTNRR
jgi:hypothetical protein